MRTGTIVRKQDTRPRTRGFNELVEVLKNGGVAVIPTDTVYGLTARVDSAEGVRKIMELKKGRPWDKGMILLVREIVEVIPFVLPQSRERILPFLETVWPGQVTVILPVGEDTFPVTAVEGTQAFRVPADDWLRAILGQVGSPLVAPSANPAGLQGSGNEERVREWFKGKVDLLVLDGDRPESPSTIVRWNERDWEIVRKVAVEIGTVAE